MTLYYTIRPLIVTIIASLLVIGTAIAEQNNSSMISKTDFVEEVIAELKARNPQVQYEYISEHDEVRPVVSKPGASQAVSFVFMGNIYAQAKTMTLRERADYIEEVLGSFGEFPSHQENVEISSLRIRLRTPEEISLRALQLGQLTQENIPDFSLTQPLGDFLIELVVDSGLTLSTFSRADLEKSELDIAGAFKIAFINTGQAKQDWREYDKGIWGADTGDDYDCARLIALNDLPEGVSAEDYVAFLPSHTTCLLAPKNDVEAIGMILDAGVDWSEDQRPLSSYLYTFNDTAWRIWMPNPDTPLFDIAALQNIKAKISDHQQQQSALERHFEDNNQDVFVAAFAAFQNEKNDLFSRAVLTEGIDTWLPKADVIVYSRAKKNDQEYIELKWPQFEKILNQSNVEPVLNVVPVRYDISGDNKGKILAAVSPLFGNNAK